MEKILGIGINVTFSGIVIVFAMLVVYCFKGVSILTFPYGLPEIISICIVVILHLWKRQMLISITGGTVLYMVLVQTIF